MWMMWECVHHRVVVRVVTGLIWLLSNTVQANHIIGGDVSMRAVGSTPGLFQIELTQYWDQTKISVGNGDASVRVLIYRKQNPILIESINISLQETLPLTFDNELCAKLRQLNFVQARYYATKQFDPQKYTDPGGYYIVWERCCRNDALTNVDAATADGVAMTFYLEFPPMTKNGSTFKNSSPEFRFPNGSYLCLNKPFTFNASATDADGDQLRYSLVTPLNGYTTRTSPTSTDSSPRASYPVIAWAQGYNLATIIPGNPPLTINATTGQLNVTASQQGLFLFSVQCEEFRNGVRIGVVRRDFQLPVVDCSKSTPPPAVVMANGKAVTDLSWCQSQPLVLTVDKNPLWAYQWKKDGDNIRGATSDTLLVQGSGTYTVVKSQANVCSNDTTSQAIKVTLMTNAPVSMSLVGTQPYCTGDTITIQAEGTSDTKYRWRRNGVDMSGEQRAILRVRQSGLYTVLTQSPSAVCDGRDSINVTFNDRPTAQLNAPALAFCPDTSVPISVTSSQSNPQYSWRLNNTTLTNSASQLNATEAGTYQVTVTAPSGCTAVSNNLTLIQYDVPTVLLDSIAPVCGTGSPAVQLKGEPAGGTFAGDGVQGSLFDPAAAGVGQHALSYTIVSNDGCRVSQTRWAEVSAGPTLTGPTTYEIVKGGSVQLVTQANEPISLYRWEPPGTLNQTDIASPVAMPVETTTYQLTAVNGLGCPSTLSVLVEVAEPLYIPSAFSPNSDGVNDSWIIPNISSFPRCEVSIYNRWGELVFFSRGYSKPWDGTFRQALVQTGIYTYQIRTGADLLPATYSGQLTVIR
ncbi:gliding motility-associated C-terminal domain-containing protein [Spirosoma sp. KNUC1025]|uniref:gliding motility-associated C-terminal domain-containing protein n=1 Tax=Spirosoma sp. KNUC1025 TaxID=2894082 RepID=UPI00386B2DAA|nr:gliding motility-associated C-terminal domain-containing protein [Spirosoma sp. KNUC1025]